MYIYGREFPEIWDMLRGGGLDVICVCTRVSVMHFLFFKFMIKK